MCELFGFSGSRLLNVSPYLQALTSHSHEHPHGWGIATFYGDGVNLEKEPKCAWISSYLQSRLQYPMEVPTVIAHIRQATCGSMTYLNCHPFVQRDIANRAWTLAHNGTIFESALLDTYRDVQSGSTDSERILCHIIQKSNALSQSLPNEATPEQRFRMVDDIIVEIAAHNKLNLLLYDGQYYYVHTNMAHTLYRKTLDSGILFATVPLDSGGWEPIPMMQLLVYDKGQLVFEGTRHGFEYHKPAEPEDVTSWIGL